MPVRTALLLGAIACLAGGAATAAPPIATPADQVKWGPAPPAMPPGAEMAVMAGDPGAKGFVSVRARLPAGYTIKPHTHPTDEHVTVLSGTAAFGMGDKIDPASETAIGPGGYFSAQAGMQHYLVAKTATVLQVDFEGPFDITYVNPADDPRRKP